MEQEQITMDSAIEKQLQLPASYARNMTPEVARRVDEFKATIDVRDKGKIIAFGREEQAAIGKFSESILNGVGTNEMGEAGELLAKCIGELKGFGADCEAENSGLLGFLKKQKTKIQNMQVKYKSLADNMDGVVKELQSKDRDLERVSREFDALYNENLQTIEFLTMVIYAGEEKLKEEKEKLAAMKREAEDNGDLVELQRVSDYNDDILRFERRLYDLKLSRTIAIQQAPQIKNIQKSSDEVSESIKTTIVTSVPLWKNQMAMALGMKSIQQGLNAVNAVKDLNNQMLIANSQMNKELSIEAAKAVERGVVDIETINIVNNNVIDAFSQSYEIAQRAITERQHAGKQLQTNEKNLKDAIIKYTGLN